jgi:hypothetical protein
MYHWHSVLVIWGSTIHSALCQSADLSNIHLACTNSINAGICQTSVLELLFKSIHVGAWESLYASFLRSWWNTFKSHLSFHFPLPFFQQGCLNIWGLTACYCSSSQEDKRKVTVEILTYNMYLRVYLCSSYPFDSFLTRLFVDDNAHRSKWKST